MNLRLDQKRQAMEMTELGKLKAGLPYDFTDPEVDALKLGAVLACQKLNVIWNEARS